MHAASSDALTVSVGCGCGCGCSVSSSDWKSSLWWWCDIARTSKLDWSGWFVLSEVAVACGPSFITTSLRWLILLDALVSCRSSMCLDGMRSWSYLVTSGEDDEYPTYISDDWMWREEEAVRSGWAMGQILYWSRTIAASRTPSHPNALYHFANQSRSAFQLSAD